MSSRFLGKNRKGKEQTQRYQTMDQESQLNKSPAGTFHKDTASDRHTIPTTLNISFIDKAENSLIPEKQSPMKDTIKFNRRYVLLGRSSGIHRLCKPLNSALPIHMLPPQDCIMN